MSSFVVASSKPHTCHTCFRPPSTPTGKMKICGGCKVVYYCSPECQKKDWPSHKESCLQTNEVAVKLIKHKAEGKITHSSRILRILPDTLHTDSTEFQHAQKLAKRTVPLPLEDKSKDRLSSKPLEHLKLAFLTTAVPAKEVLSKEALPEKIPSKKDLLKKDILSRAEKECSAKFAPQCRIVIDLVEVLKKENRAFKDFAPYIETSAPDKGPTSLPGCILWLETTLQTHCHPLFYLELYRLLRFQSLQSTSPADKLTIRLRAYAHRHIGFILTKADLACLNASANKETWETVYNKQIRSPYHHDWITMATPNPDEANNVVRQWAAIILEGVLEKMDQLSSPRWVQYFTSESVTLGQNTLKSEEEWFKVRKQFLDKALKKLNETSTKILQELESTTAAPII